MPKNIFRHCFLLLTILLFSCDQNASCIDADDFGDIEREFLTVYPAITDQCLVPTGIGGHKEGYSGIVVPSGAISTDPPKVLKDCLTEDATLNTNGPDISAQLGTKEDSTKNGCLAYTTESKIMICESFCETNCYDNSTPPNIQPNWLTNTPRGKDSDFGINITPGSQIFVSVEDGSINLSGGIVNPANLIGGTGQPSYLFFSDMSQFPHSSSGTPPFIAQAGYSYSTNISSQYAFTPPNPATSIIGNGLTEIQRYHLLSKNIISFTPYPSNYPSVPIEANLDTWKCLEGFPNDKNKMKCSFPDPSGEDDYSGYSASNNNLMSSRAYEVGTNGDAHQITNYGGFIRFNNDGVNNIKVFVLSGLTNSSAVEQSSDESYDQFIDLKARDTQCNNIPINISIIDKSDPNKIHYKSDNLILSSSSYTSKNIPFYSDSKIKIELHSGASSSFNTGCIISVKSQKYLDIKMPISGFVQFKMKDLENISYGDLKGNYVTGEPSLQTNFMDCNTNNYGFAQSFYINKDAGGNFKGIGIDCKSSIAPSAPLIRSIINGGSAQYIGALSGTSQTITSSVTAGKEGFSKIQIIKDSNYVNKIKFFPFDSTASATAIHDSSGFTCNTRNNCSEISCNGAKISGIKAQFDGTSIKALSVICQGYEISQSQNSCDIYGRIINPNGAKIILPTPSPVSPTPIITETPASKEVFIKSGASAISIDKSSGASTISDVFIGLDGYANKNHSEINPNSCRARLNIPGCAIGTKICNITQSSYSDILPQNECSHAGNGEAGTIIDTNYGTGGGGGGNLEGIAGNASSGGKTGESYINPEFINAPETSTTFIGNDDGQGKIELTNEDGATIAVVSTNYAEQNIIYTFPAGKNLINYKIRGGSGGKGGDCNNAQATYAGGAGGKGDSFEGTLDFTEALTRKGGSRQLTFRIKLGQKGSDGKHCSFDTSAQPINFSKNQDTGKLKGGDGGGALASEDMATGGAGGSASYIVLVRSDEADDLSREDFLVIAGAGGGGNGARKATASGAPADQAFARTNELKTYINGYRIFVAFSSSTIPTLASGFNYDYYEYDDFLTKTETSSSDPLKKFNVNPVSYKPDAGIFVRKDQILRILPKTFETIWNSKEGPKECGVGMIMKITPRPAVLCLSDIGEKIKNPSCIPQYPTTSATVSVSGSASIGSAPASSTQEGCQGSFDCTLSPILSTASVPGGSTYCPDASCSAINCTGGTEDTANTCTASSPTGCNSTIAKADDPTILYQYTSATCQECRTRKENLAKTSPNITITSACYNFEDKTNISVSRFLSQFNAAGSGAPKTKIITDNNIPKISDFNEGQNFGNFASAESSNNNQFFKLKNPITVSNNGEFKGFIINDSDFKTLSILSTTTNNVTQIDFTTQATYSKGRGLQMYLCKETDANGVDCNGAEPLPNANVKTKYIDGNPSLDYFEFASSSKIQKKSTPVLTNICDQYASSQSDNFICFKDDLGNEDEIKKYRLAFRINDFYDNDYSNNSGNYRIKIEKRNISSSRAGGIINGILEPIITNLDGSIDDPTTAENESSEGIVKGFYLTIIQNSLYRWISSLTIVLALSFYGMGYLMGINEMKHSEIAKILFKIGFIYLFTSTSSGWAWFNKLFIDFFKNGIDYITYSVAENFDRVNAQEINAKIISGDFYNKGILFKSVDNVIDLLLTGAVQKKIMALLFSSIFGWVYFLILFNCLITYIYAIANSMLLYITCQIVVSILFTLGPIFFIFLMFKVTKEIFDNWIKALIGFSLQQIFLIMTLALFNSFVISFLKLALGYRVCWTNILSLNIALTKVSLLNFWTIAGVNAPEGYSEESPEQSFGNDQNMPSLYLFLYLMIVVTLMKKFIEMFTNLAVSLSGGLKASTIGGDVNQLGQQAFKAMSKVASGIYERTVGRAVANVDSVLFDSGKIADQKRSDKRQQFAEDMKTRASLMGAGNDAVSKYKKENAIEFAGMDNNQKREKLEQVKMSGMKEYAKENDIGDKKLDKLLNQSGLNYTGTNLFGAAYQAGTQAAYSGGNLFNSIRDKKVDTSFSKTEANATLKNMKETDQKAFLEKVEKGDIHVNKGKIEKIRSGAISAVKAPGKIASGIGYAALNPKTAMKNVASAAQSINPFKTNQVKKEAIQQLQDSGKIDKFKNVVPILKVPTYIPNVVKNWARTDEEKKLIRDKMREISKDKASDSTKEKATSQSVIKDLKTTIDYTKNLKDNGGTKTEQAKAKRFASRVANMFSKNEPKQTISDEKTTKQFESLKQSGAGEISQLKSQKDNLGRAIEGVDSKLRSQDEFKKFNILEKTQKSLEATGGISKEIREEISKTGDNSLEKFLKRNDELNNASRLGRYVANSKLAKGLGAIYNNTIGKLPAMPGSKTVKNLATDASSKVAQNIRLDHVKNSLKEEVASNPLLKDTLDQRQQFRGELNEVSSKINSLEGRSANIDKREQAQKINETNLKTIQEYKDKPLASRIELAIFSKASSIAMIRPLARAINSATGNKIGYAKYFKDREGFKKAKKAVSEFKKLKTPEDFGNFVEKGNKN
jgi:type IV secretory pathway VirB6-like protein